MMLKIQLIMNRVMVDSDKPNNKIATAYSRYVTTLINGYFLGGKLLIILYQMNSLKPL